MSTYSGGAHSAEVVATDGAGNTATTRWTINVDPEGHISTTEAENTLEAVDATSESTVVAPTSAVVEPEDIGDNPGLKVSGTEIESTGVPDTTTMTTNPEDGFEIESPEGTLKISPLISEQSSEVQVAEEVAAVAANVEEEVDSIVRPQYNGAQSFQAIRSDESPESYSWNLHLSAGQSLTSVNSNSAEVVYEDGTVAFLITAEAAHDATGASVPTMLEVNGNVLTLKVEFHSGSFVYPIVAGEGWETSYIAPILVEGPEDETELREREEREEQEAAEAEEAPATSPPSSAFFTEAEAEVMRKMAPVGSSFVPAPEPVEIGGEQARISGRPTMTVKPFKVCQRNSCSNYWMEISNPSFWYGQVNHRDWVEWEGVTNGPLQVVVE